jgi:hypothetical protein
LKENLIEQCQSEYKNNLPVLRKIDDFRQSFKPDDVFRWYTNDSFMYRLLNKVFRTRNIDLISRFQYFIILLFKKVESLSCIDDDIDSHTWNEIEPESDAEFLEDHGLIEEVTSISDDNTINPLDCYPHFITDEIIDLTVRETNRYAQQCLQRHEISRRSILHQWKPTTNKEILKFFRIIIEIGLVKMPKLKYYWSSSQLYGSDIIRIKIGFPS